MSGGRSTTAPDQTMAREIEELEDRCDTLALLLARYQTANDERIPSGVVERLAAGESPLKVWREYRGMDVAELAHKAGTGQLTIELLEAPGKSELQTLERMAPIARALGIDLEDLLPWPQEDGRP